MQNISTFAIFNDQSFKDTLTNDIVTFEQLHPDIISTISKYRVTFYGLHTSTQQQLPLSHYILRNSIFLLLLLLLLFSFALLFFYYYYLIYFLLNAEQLETNRQKNRIGLNESFHEE